jgi:hypothetical protein
MFIHSTKNLLVLDQFHEHSRTFSMSRFSLLSPDNDLHPKNSMLTLARTLIVAAVARAGTPPGGAAVTLNNGLAFPYMSFGLQVYDDDTAKSLTIMSIEAGVRTTVP